VEAGRGGGRGARTEHAVHFRSPGGDVVVGTLTLSMRLQRPLHEALAAYRAQRPFSWLQRSSVSGGAEELRSSFEFPKLTRASSGSGSTGGGLPPLEEQHGGSGGASRHLYRHLKKGKGIAVGARVRGGATSRPGHQPDRACLAHAAGPGGARGRRHPGRAGAV
jgi:hypothetical protein